MDPTIEHPVINAEIETITFRNEDNGWSVVRIRLEDGQLTTATGVFPHLRIGETVSIKGEWTSHKVHGRQFKAISTQAYVPETSEAMIKYLSSGLVKGIGRKTAEKIVGHFKSKTLEILDNEPERLEEVPRIGKAKAATIAKSWSKSQQYREAELLLLSYDLSLGLTAKIIRAYQSKTLTIVKTQPYRLCNEISGIGFLTADKIARSAGISETSPERIEAATLYLIKQSEDKGHCFLYTKQLIEKLEELLKVDSTSLDESFLQVITNLNQAGKIVSQSIDDTSIHYRYDLLVAEETLSQKLSQLLASPMAVDEDRIDSWLDRYAKATNQSLSTDQLSAVKKAASSRVFVLTGGPGVGKTTTANAIIALLKAMNKTVALAAPTGRAAQRLTEVATVQAKTVHRLLEWTPQDNGFTRNEDNPLDCQVVVIDESSMLDIRLANALVQAVPERGQIIFIGDVDQLPSVGPGNVLRDLIDSCSVPFTRLMEIFRQAATSAIVSTAHKINSGHIPIFSSDNSCDCRFIETEGVSDTKSVIQELIGDILPNKSNYDPIRDVQILTPMNRGDLGTKQLNTELQQLLNPIDDQAMESTVDTTTYRSGDKVIQMANNYDLNVFNGDIGYIVNAGVDGGKIIVDFHGRQVRYRKEDAYDLKLAYAITIHKSQGSEFPVVVIPMSMQHYIMLQRNLIYTALTRAKKFAVFVGTKSALEHAIRNQKSLERQTYLINRIQSHL
ncbi:MAG: ATP-dependent RecD-like DNA helicase [Pseudobacteriovorax sp.]|nr:ATP-dependent RecD-like DNA helicase [Pseudobacteriovorax sp.]